MKPAVYLDTTVPSYLFDERESIALHIDITQRWWNEERFGYDIWASEETVNEILAGDYPNKEKVLQFMAGVPILEPNPLIADIAQVYLDHYLMPRVQQGDALHLAYASFYKIDFLLTWNCNHLANANKRQHIRVINARLNLSTPEITTPLELFKETKDDH
ncbi:hypothetical protein Thiowin_03997 [Thiorhodovibrio winogradskyi]|uniref:PIN domain-containing protein n=1 Tax=Thiorhodovibrio winogradskyi TaxID=77007 RepID=A0ABZ0SE77_9GAMM|nr:type II toxin-antitoxin system VapC family toxin [Thiorhodovibrio winogradskyi]